MRKIRSIAPVVASMFALAMVSACSSPEQPADDAATTAATSNNAAAPATPAAATPAAATVTYASLTGDAAKGEQVFLQCKACHVVEPGVNRIGPSLHGVVGRESGSIEGFRYSPANKAGHIVWTEETLFEYLEDPRKFLPGTYMAFAGLKNPQDRADVIAYLKANSS
jgi:cytochrome c